MPVWKQVRQENVAEVFPTKDKKNENLKEDSRIASAKAEETREQRAKRLTGLVNFSHPLTPVRLIDLHLKKSPPNIESALKCMGKAKDVSLGFCHFDHLYCR